MRRLYEQDEGAKVVFVLHARHNEEGGGDWRGRDAFFFLINICTANIHSTMLIVPIHIPPE